MGRPRKDGTPAQAINKRKLTDLFVKTTKASGLVWDERCPGLALSVRPSGRRAWKVVYRFHGRPVWIHLGDARSIGLADARRIAQKTMLAVAEGRDPAADRKAERATGTFADLAGQYVELHAKKHNKSWKQAEALVQKHLLPRWGRLKAAAITRADVRAVVARIDAPIMANQILAAASAVFSWAIKQEILTLNPCKLVQRNPTASRERVLSDAEVALLWPRLSANLRLVLLTGQRPGEVSAMQREHIADGWWQLPGKPAGAWPGTKNGRDHRVWLSEVALGTLAEHLAQKVSITVPAKQLARLVAELGIERCTPHDLRRTCLTMVTRLGFGRDAMDRVANHKSNKVTDVYDRHGYAEEDKRIMAAVARLVMSLVEGEAQTNVVSLRASP